MISADGMHTAVLNSLDEQIAVLDGTGTIVDVNRSWKDFGAGNGLVSEASCVGDSYLETLLSSIRTGDALAGDALRGMRSVMERRAKSFYLEYPCHSPSEKRWFTMRIVPILGLDRTDLFVVSHHNVTQRKLAELRVEELAMLDSLTGLANRRAFSQFFARELRSCARNRKPLSLALLDLDRFKGWNDEFGHDAGDQCLMAFARELRAVAQRPSDLAARIGGDEFALVLGDTAAASAIAMAERLLASLGEVALPFAPGRSLGSSIGIVSRIPASGDSAESFVRDADKALYRAKGEGRGRVCLAEPPA